MKKIGLCLIFCMCMLTQTVFVYANTSDNISTEIDNEFPTVAVQFGKTKLNVGNELTLSKDEVNKSILFAGNEVQITNLKAKRILGAGGSIRLLEENQSDYVLIAGETLDVDGKYDKVYLSGAHVAFHGQSDVLNIAGERIELTGDAGTVSLTGDTVIIAGTITGDLKIAAKNIEFKNGAKVSGKINIWSENKATISGQLSEDNMTYHSGKVVKWGFWLPTSISIGSNLVAYGIIMILSFVFNTIGLLKLRIVFRKVKEKAWRVVVLQGLMNVSVLILFAWVLTTVMGFNLTAVIIMYLAIWLASTPVMCQLILGRQAILKRYLLLFGLLSIGVYELLMFNPHLGWGLGIVNILLIAGSIGTDLVKNKKLTIKVKP